MAKNNYYHRFTDDNVSAQHDPALSVHLSVLTTLMDSSFMSDEWLDRLADEIEKKLEVEP